MGSSEASSPVKLKNWFFGLRSRVGLRARIVWNLSLLMVCAVVLINFIFFKMVERQWYQNLIEQEKMFLQVFGKVLSPLLSQASLHLDDGFKGKHELNSLLSSFEQQRSWEQIAVVSPQFKVIYHSDPARIGGVENNVHVKSALAMKLPMTSYVREPGLLKTMSAPKAWIAAPLLDGRNVIGGVLVALPPFSLWDVLGGSGYYLLLYLLVFTGFLILFGGMLISLSVVHPIKALTSATEKVAEGDLDYRVEEEGENEVSQLAGHFNVMVQRLKKSHADINEHLADLERANQKLVQSRAEVIRSEQLSTVGKFAASMAHEIGNPLSAILGYLDMMIKKRVSSDEYQEYLERMERELSRIDQTLRTLLSFSRPSPEEMKRVNVNQVMEEAWQLLSHHPSASRVRPKLRFSQGLPETLADGHQLQQVLVNLILNAMEAMPEGGELTLETLRQKFRGFLQGDEGMPRRRKEDRRLPFSEGEEIVSLTVGDTGEGIPPDVRRKIFDPFFTTRPMGDGVGLGLTICHRIVESFGGIISVSSELGRGSTFEILLPLA